MEFFLTASSNSFDRAPRRQVQKLALITGFQELPPYYSFGFHYSKWQDISTSILHQLVDAFDRYEMPFDVLWMDIEYADKRRYFALDEKKFSNFHGFVDRMANQHKRLAIITDPHIKVDENFFVYSEGLKVKMA